MKRSKILKVSLALGSIFAITALAVPSGDFLKKAVKAAAVGVGIKHLGPQINKAVNKISGHKETPQTSTKVVPIVGVGAGTHLGAAQVMGPVEQVKKVKFVVQMEGVAVGVRARVLVPVSKTGLFKDLSRIQNVGVSAIIDTRL